MTAVNVADPELRRSGIGGSDAPMVLNVSRYGTPIDVYMEKIGMRAPLIETEAMRWGKLLEEPISREYARRTERRVRRVNRTLRHPTYPWMFAHIDRAVVGERLGLEAKNADKYRASEFGEPGSDQVPDEYTIQVQHYMGVTGWPAFDLAVLIGGNKFGQYHIPRDDALIDDIIEIEHNFWQNKEKGIPPDVDGSPGWGAYLRATIKENPVEQIEATEELSRLADAWRRWDQVLDRDKDQRDLVRHKIEQLLGRPAKVEGPDYRLSYSMVSGARRTDWQAVAREIASLPPPWPEWAKARIAEHTSKGADYPRFTLTDRS